MRAITIAGILVGTLQAASGQTALERMFDSELTSAQRNDACFALRGEESPKVKAAMRKALAIDPLRGCAAANLRVADAVDELKDALKSDDFAVRAAAARELGTFQRADLLAPLAGAAADPNPLVATNAMDGLSRYNGPAVVPYLEKIAEKGGLVGVMALNRMAVLDKPAALQVARALLARGEAPDRVSALRIIGENGDVSDLEALRAIAAQKNNVTARQRGFGLMPPIDLSQAASEAIQQIEKRQGENQTNAR